MSFKKLYLVLLSTAFLSFSFSAAAQEQQLDDQEILNIENIYKTEIPKMSQPLPAPLPAVTSDSSNATPLETAESENQAPAAPAPKSQKVETLTDLNKLSPFSEISVIQKKFLPKTERFQLYAGGGTTTNSPWFLNMGLKLNFGYHFTESLGVELSGLFLSNSEREVAKEIRDNNLLQPEKFINTKSYVGIDVVWAPIYGKLTMLNKRIIPFDMYISAGGGTSSTNSQEGSVPTLHVGVGQIFAINKSMAFRWDYSWTTFQATPIPDKLANGLAEKNSYNDLILTAGFSFFFPEVRYR